MARPSKTGVRGLQRDGQGRWVIDLRWREPSTGAARRHCERLPANLPAAAAKTRAREILASALQGNFDPRKREHQRLGDALNEYIKWAEANRPRSIRSRRTISRALKEGLKEDLSLDNMSVFAVEKYKRARLQDVGPASVNREIAMLKHFCNYAVEHEWMEAETARAIRAVRLLKEPPGRVRYLSTDEEKALLAALPRSIRVIVRAADLSGMRRSEVVLLRKDAVDLRNRVITLTKTKSNKVRRIPINDALAKILDEAMRRSTSDYVFTTRRVRPYQPDSVSRAFHRAVEAAEIDDLRLHDIRHDFATKLRRRGVGIDVIKELLGHADITTTMRYAHVEQELLREAVAKLDKPKLAAPLPRQTLKRHAKVVDIRSVAKKRPRIS